MIADPPSVPTQTPVAPVDETMRRGWRRPQLGGRQPNRRAATLPPYEVVAIPRMLLAVGMGAMSALTLGGAVLMLLVWQQSSSGVVSSDELARVWNLFEVLRTNEIAIGVLCVPTLAIWVALATLNVRRATCQRRNPVAVAVLFAAAPLAVCWVGVEVVSTATVWWQQVMGVAIQAAIIAVPMVAFEYVANTTGGARRPIRAAALLSIVAVAHVQFLGGLGTVASDDPTLDGRWGQVAAYLGILAVLQAMAALAVNEACRSLEESTLHRHELRKAFGSALTMVGSLKSSAR